MTPSETRPLSRRYFFAAVGLTAAAGLAGADEPTPTSADLPRTELLSDGDVKTYLLVFHTGQEVMKGLVAVARKHKLTAGHLTGIVVVGPSAAPRSVRPYLR